VLARIEAFIFLSIVVSRGITVGFRNVGFWVEVWERWLVPLSSELAEEKRLALGCGFDKLLELACAIATFVWRHVCNYFCEDQSRGRRFPGKSSRAPFFERASRLPAAGWAAPRLALEPEVATHVCEALSGAYVLHEDHAP